MSIANVLTDLIKYYGLNALELEKLTGVPSSTIYRLLKNKGGNPTIDVLKKLSCFFQITVSQLIGEEPLGCKQVPLVEPATLSSFIDAGDRDNIENENLIPVEFPVSNASFATLCADDMMEPFIPINSIIIVDPTRPLSNKDFVLLIKNKNSMPIVRQLIIDFDLMYLKVVNQNYPIEPIKISKLECFFIAPVVHYRMNLYSFDSAEFLSSNLKVKKI